MENEILEILKRLETKVDNIEKKLDGVAEQIAKVGSLREDLTTVEKVVKENCYDIAKLRVKNDSIETLEVIKYKIQRLDDDVIDLKNKIKSIE